MSAILYGLAWRARGLDQSAKMLLIRLVECAADDGSRIFPSKERLAADCCVSVRTVQRILRHFETSGLIVIVAHGEGGRGRATEYRLSIEALEGLVARDGDAVSRLGVAAAKAARSEDEGALKGDTLSPFDVGEGGEKGDMVSPFARERVTPATLKGDRAVSPQPSYNPQSFEREARGEREGRSGEAGEAGDGKGSAARPGDGKASDGKSSERAGEARRLRADAEAAREAAAAHGDAPFLAFLAGWEGAAADSLVRSHRAWLALSPEERAEAAAKSAAYQAYRRGVQRKFVIAPFTYLTEKAWKLLPEGGIAGAGAADPAMPLSPWKRNFWVWLWATLEAGNLGKARFRLNEAKAGRAQPIRASEMPSQAAEAALVGLDRDGPEAAAWFAFLARSGLLLSRSDIPPQQIWAPSRWPPGHRSAAAAADLAAFAEGG